jgi:hypothetical protein
MPTIEELFKSKKLSSGKTAQEQYDIRNTKATPISSYNPLLSYTSSPLQKLRNGTDKMKETKLESETSGLRILSTLSSPILYGTDIIRLTRKSSNLVDTMKGATNGDSSGGGLLGKIGGKLNTFASKIGIAFPEDIIPSKLYLNKDFNTGKDKGGEGSTMEKLSKIKSKSAGNFLGNFLKGTFEGKPSSNGIIGNALDGAKTAITKFALSSRKQGAQNLAQQSKVGFDFVATGGFPIITPYRFTPYDSLKKYSSTIDKTLTEDGINTRGDLSSLYNNFNFEAKPIGPDNYPIGPYENRNILKFPKSKWSSHEIENDWNTEKKLGISYGLVGVINGQTVRRGNRDYYNTLVPYKSETGLKATNIPDTDTQVDEYDFVALKFWSVYKKSAVNFRATISGLTETVTPNWDSNRFVGNPFNFYTYNSIERSVSFTFKVYSLHPDEHIAAWQRLSFLTSLTYPQGYPNNFSVAAPFIKFTLGDMFRNKEAFIESLTYTVDDNSPWDIGIDKSTKDFKLPKIIDVAITLKLVETVGSTYEFPKVGKQLDASGNPAKGADGKPLPDIVVDGFTKRLYGYGGKGAGNPIEIDVEKRLNPDASPQDGEMLPDVVVSAKRNKDAGSPEEQKPQKPRNPKGELVAKYKDYNIFKKQQGAFITMMVWDGDRLVRTGPESRSEPDSGLIEYEKRAIDDIEEIRMRNLQQDVTALVTSPL